MSLIAYANGLTMGLSLIVAIGAQNAFVLRQGLRGEHVLAVCLVCAGSDAVLIAVGVGFFHQIAVMLPGLLPVMRYGGAAFLLWYGVRSLRAALAAPGALVASETDAQRLSAVLTTCLALTWLNPHVYLDTVVLLGSIASQYPGQQAWFALGAMSASFGFFFTLGYGARWLRPLLARPAAWRVIEIAIAATMFAIAARLLFGSLQ